MDTTSTVNLQIGGTPTFVLAKRAKDKSDGVRIVGAQPFAAFQSAIDHPQEPALMLQSAVYGKGN